MLYRKFLDNIEKESKQDLIVSLSGVCRFDGNISDINFVKKKGSEKTQL